MSLISRATDASNALYATLNGMAGRSWFFDNLIALPMDNALVKAAPVGACFIYAWHAGRDEATIAARRKILLVTLGALLLVLATTKTISENIFLPRPFVLSQQSYHLEEGRLVERARLPYRAPLAGENRDRYEALERGDIAPNDLGSFPSDHAAFYTALALGILLACHAAGLIALAWTLIVILASRIVTGMHSPLDILAGASIGAAILLPAQYAARRWGGRLLDPIAGWTVRHQGWASALLFLAIFEASNTLVNARHAAGVARDSLFILVGA